LRHGSERLPGRKGKPGYRTPATFKSRVFQIVSDIAKGKTLSYGEVAKRAGNPKAARAVGNILNKNYDPKIPCHRVIRSSGKFGGYNKGFKKKAAILIRERRDVKHH